MAAASTAIGESLIPVTLLTGFLGSGKTTVLNRLLRRPDLEATAVIVNEFGEIGLDQVLIERSSSGTVLLNNGCVCCTVREDLGATLLELLVQQARGEIPAFRRVIIETTGLADPAPILHLLMSDLVVAVRYRLGGVVSTVDAVNGLGTLQRHAEAVKQAAVADRLLITKTDLVAPQASAQLRERLRALNPGARMIDVLDGEIDPARLFDTALYNAETKSVDVRNWLRAEAYEAAGWADDVSCQPGCAHDHDHHHHRGPGRHDHGISSYCIVREQPVPWEAFSAWMELISSRRGDDLLRVKGIVNIAERPGKPVVVHGVQQIFHPPVSLDAWPDEDHRTRIVFITRDIDQAALDATLRVLESA
jgi:G3E family GTPase